MTEILNAIFPAAAGLGLGVLFFGGLWWTVRVAMKSDQPGVWFLASQFIRTGITLAGFFLVADGQWQRLLIALAGFLMARLVVIQWTAPAGTAEPQPRPGVPEKARHAS